MEKIKEKTIRIFDKYLGDDYLLFVFGSFAKGKPIKSSDIDLAVYREKRIPSGAIVQAKDEMERNLGILRDIDLVNLTDEATSIKLLENILEEGVIWRKGKNSEELLKNLKKRLKSSKK